MLCVIDNYDSFTYNLVQYLGELYKGEVRVFRNDTIAVPAIAEQKPTHIVISPGPCTPKEAGISVETVKMLGPTIPILGVCLGHQSVGAAFGGKVVRASTLMHGKTSEIHHTGKGIYKGLPNPFVATRYHSLVIDRPTCPQCLAITAETDDGVIMGVTHRDYPVFGVQFHPEAILTVGGKKLLKNFLRVSP